MPNDKVINKKKWHFTQIENEIIETEQMDIYQKMAYICLSMFANRHTNEAFPAVKTIAKMAGASERKIRSVLHELRDKGLISIEPRENSSNVYTLLELPANIKSTPAADAVPHAQDAGGHAPGAGVGVHDMHAPPAPDADEQYSINKNHSEQEEKKDTPPYGEVISYLNERTNKKFKASSDKSKRHIQARYNEGFTLDDFKQVIDNKTNEWLNSEQMNRYLRPETLFGTKFESYLNEGGTHHAENRGSYSADTQLPF